MTRQRCLVSAKAEHPAEHGWTLLRSMTTYPQQRPAHPRQRWYIPSAGGGVPPRRWAPRPSNGPSTDVSLPSCLLSPRLPAPIPPPSARRTRKAGAVWGSSQTCSITAMKSANNVGKLRSHSASGGPLTLVFPACQLPPHSTALFNSPCPRASKANTPNSAPLFAATSFASAAKLSALAPAPWWQTR